MIVKKKSFFYLDKVWGFFDDDDDEKTSDLFVYVTAYLYVLIKLSESKALVVDSRACDHFVFI